MADFELADSKFSRDQDFFGPTMNLCAKINNKAPPNSMIIGGDLHQVLKKLHSLEKDFQFEEISEFSIGLKLRYPIHLVVPINLNNNRIHYPQLKGLYYTTMKSESEMSTLVNEFNYLRNCRIKSE